MQPRADLRTVVESVAERLNRSLGSLFQEELEKAAGAEPEPVAPAVTRELRRRALERFWSSVLDSARPFLESIQRSPALFLRRLHHRWMEVLRLEAHPSFAAPLAELLPTFPDLLSLDGSRLDELARRLVGRGRRPVVPGQVGALYDIRRGFAVRVWFEPDADRPDPAGQPESFEGLKKGSLVLGDERHATPELWRRLEELGVHGAFRVRHAGKFRAATVQVEELVEGEQVLDSALEHESRSLRLITMPRKRLALLTDVRDRGTLSSNAAVQLARNHWRVTQIFHDVAGVVNIAALGNAKPREVEGQVYAAALLSAALRAAQGWIAFEKGLPPEALAPDVIIPLLGLTASVLARRDPEPVPPRVEPARPSPEEGSVIFVDLPEIRPHSSGSEVGAFLTGDTAGRTLLSPLGPPEGKTLPSPLGPPEGTPARIDALEMRPVLPDLAGPLAAAEPGPAAPRRNPPLPASREEMIAISRCELDPAFEPFCQDYAKVGYRDTFLWRWVQRGIELTTLASIDLPWRGPNRTVKLLGVMLDVLLDDVADNLKDGEFLSALLHIPFSPDTAPAAALVNGGSLDGKGLDEEKVRYHLFTAKVWKEIHRRARSFPRYEELREVFEFDYRQLLNTMRYAFVVNRLPDILNPTEHDLYQPHNMHMMISGTLDLMCSTGFDMRELALVRQALWRGQVMGRIGNMVSTWEREIKERDFTSGVFAAAIERGAVVASELPLMDPTVLRQAIERSGVIAHFLRQWERLRDEVYQLAGRVHSVDLGTYAAGLEELIRNHLGSRGLK